MSNAGKWRVAVALLALLVGTPAFAAPLSVGPFRLPDEVAGFSRGAATNLARTNPGQGTQVEYAAPGWRGDVTIYDLQRRAIPDDPKSAIVRAEFERQREEAFLAAPRGPYRQVYLRRNFLLEEGGRARFQCAAFRLEREGATSQDGFLCVTARRNQFVKVRLVTLSDPNTEAQARKTIAGFVPVFWDAGAAEPKPAARVGRR